MKNPQQSHFGSLLAASILILSLPRFANAYVDPGSGALIWQMGVAAVLGSLFYIRRAAKWLRSRFVKNSDGISTAAPEADPEDSGVSEV